MQLSPYALVIDDHPLVARGMAQYLVTHCGFTSVHVAANAAEGLRRVQSDGPPTLAVVDFWLPEGAAPALLRQLAERCAPTRLLAVSGDDNLGIQPQVREAGAHGFLRKHEAPEVFAQAVGALCAGGSWFSLVDEVVFASPASRELPVHARDLGLTERQGQVLSLILRGLPNKRIARELGLSEPTVKEHVTNILTRLGVSNRIQTIQLLRGRRIAP